MILIGVGAKGVGSFFVASQVMVIVWGGSLKRLDVQRCTLISQTQDFSLLTGGMLSDERTE